MQPVVRVAQAIAQSGGGGSAEVSGPFVVELGQYAGYACAWIVWMRGAASAEWALTWDDMGINPDYVQFDTAFGGSDTVQIIVTNNNVANVIAYATVAGTTYASDPVACAI